MGTTDEDASNLISKSDTSNATEKRVKSARFTPDQMHIASSSYSSRLSSRMSQRTKHDIILSPSLLLDLCSTTGSEPSDVFDEVETINTEDLSFVKSVQTPPVGPVPPKEATAVWRARACLRILAEIGASHTDVTPCSSDRRVRRGDLL